MKLKVNLFIAPILGAFLIGCASVGNNFDENKITQIKKGETTEAQLVEMFGQPQNRTVNSEGQTTLSWIYAESSVKGESFIPYAGAFMGGHNSKSKSLNVTLQDGKVTTYACTGGGMESRNMTQDVPKK